MCHAALLETNHVVGLSQHVSYNYIVLPNFSLKDLWFISVQFTIMLRELSIHWSSLVGTQHKTAEADLRELGYEGLG